MSAAKVLRDVALARLLADPGDGETIDVEEQSPRCCNLVSTTTETRTLRQALEPGNILTIGMKTDGGDITLTVTGGYNENGDTDFVFTDAGQFIVLVSIDVGGTILWRLVSHYQLGNSSPNNVLAVEAGAGVTGGTGTVYESSVTKIGGIITTQIVLNLTGLDSSGTAGDIIGLSTGGAAHLGQITAARNGTIFAGTIRCLEVPTGGDPDVDFFSASVATGAFDAAVSGLSGQSQLINTGDWTLEEDTLTALPPADSYLYAVAGATDDATYTAGKFLITLYGV